MQPAVFLDRDGVLCEEKGYISRLEEMIIFPYAQQCIADIHDIGWLAIVVTNQSGVAKGVLTEEELLKMNNKLIIETGVDEVYYCPYHIDGAIKKYKIDSPLRKPKTGMVDMACKEYSIDRNNSFVVGDRASDIILGKNAKMKTVLLESGYGTVRLEQDVEPDYILDDLRDVVSILERNA